MSTVTSETCPHCGKAENPACADQWWHQEHRSPGTMRTETSKTLAERIATQVVENVCELPDYNSPDDQPDLVMCTVQELENCVLRAFEAPAPETLPVGLSESLRAEAATVKLGECMPAGRFPEGVSRYNALMWAAELIDERAALKADERRPGNCNRRNTPGDPCDRNCNWPECGCVCGTDGVMRPALSEGDQRG